MTTGWHGARRARGWGRAVALASALVAAQVGSALHLALVDHAVCPVDGELVHESRAERSLRPAPSDRPGVDSRQPSNAERGHGHCAVAAHSRVPVTVQAPCAAGAPARLLASARLLEARRGLPRLCLHRLAPKQSPPA